MHRLGKFPMYANLSQRYAKVNIINHVMYKLLCILYINDTDICTTNNKYGLLSKCFDTSI